MATFSLRTRKAILTMFRRAMRCYCIEVQRSSEATYAWFSLIVPECFGSTVTSTSGTGQISETHGFCRLHKASKIVLAACNGTLMRAKPLEWSILVSREIFLIKKLRIDLLCFGIKHWVENENAHGYPTPTGTRHVVISVPSILSDELWCLSSSRSMQHLFWKLIVAAQYLYHCWWTDFAASAPGSRSNVHVRFWQWRVFTGTKKEICVQIEILCSFSYG